MRFIVFVAFLSLLCWLTSKVRGTDVFLCPGGGWPTCSSGFELCIEPGCAPSYCIDIDECSEATTNICPENEWCTNTNGSFTCDCVQLYTRDENGTCIFEPCGGLPSCAAPNFKLLKCPPGQGGDGITCVDDSDMDGVPDTAVDCEGIRCQADNCPDYPNSGQEDADEDGTGDACSSSDIDGDTIGFSDNCPNVPNTDQADSDGDGIGDVCDNCPDVPSTDQTDSDGDGKGDPCEEDADNDGIPNTTDNCPTVQNPGQENNDTDTMGDACDNCPYVTNENQADSDQDFVGDACDTNSDKDNDGIQDDLDNCENTPNNGQLDTDNDGLGDECDPDIDGDGVNNDEDNCPYVPNADQANSNDHENPLCNLRGDACKRNTDQDPFDDEFDNCPTRKDIYGIDFRKLQLIELGDLDWHPASRWTVLNQGAEIIEHENSDPAAVIGYDQFSNLDFEVSVFVDQEWDDDFIGAVFAFQNNKKFYLATWKRDYQNLGFTTSPGLEVKLINQESGSINDLTKGLLHDGDVPGVSKLLWKDPQRIGWQNKVPYRMKVMHRPAIGLMRIRFYDGKTLAADSGDVWDSTLTGGRVGCFVSSQHRVIFYDMVYSCNNEVTQDTYDNLTPEQREHVVLGPDLPLADQPNELTILDC